MTEKGSGLDRTFYRLPVLQLEDFSEVSSDIIRQAYVEALYRVDEWDYTRLTRSYWQNLIFTTAQLGNTDELLRLHPMSAEDETFTRPLIPYNCEAMGGCGPGTKRIPLNSCAITPDLDYSTYDWYWHERPHILKNEAERAQRQARKRRKEIARGNQ